MSKENQVSLNEDWQFGAANFSYLLEGQWHQVEAAQETVSSDETQQNLDAFTTFTSVNKPSVAA